MKIIVFGNPDAAGDNIVFQILPKLRKKFPNIQFIHKDPLENFTRENEKIIILDAVQGITKVKIFKNLENFTTAHKRMTMHDFDVYDELILLQKLKKLPKATIIGVPWGARKDVLEGVISSIKLLQMTHDQ